MQFLFTFIVSLIITMFLVPPLIKLAPRIGAIDLPDDRKVHKDAIPRIGGIAMIIGAMVPMVFWLPLDRQVVALLASFLILLFFGIWDDRSNLNYKIKFLGQFIAVLVVVLIGDIVVYRFPFIDSNLPDYIAIPFTVFALVGITNAINLSDGLDGLAGGTSLLTFSMIAFLGYKSDNLQLVLICLAVSGSIMGFLRHNTYPARIFMGDTGSQFLGFSAGVLVIVLSQEANRAMSPVVPLMLLGLPILDTVGVMAQRIYENRSPFSPDKNHIHHKLLHLGFDHYEAVFIIYLLQTLLVSLAFIMRYESDFLILSTYIVFSIVALYLFHLAQVTGWTFDSDPPKSGRYDSWIKKLRHSPHIELGSIYVLKIGIPIFFVVSMFVPERINADIGILSLIMLLVFCAVILYTNRVTLLEKIAVYVMCALAVFLIESSSVLISEYSNYVNGYLMLLALAFAIRIKISKDQSFQITPLDFLVVLLVLVVPNLPEFSLVGVNLGDVAVKLILLFYTSEAILNIIAKKYDIFRIGFLLSLLVGTTRWLMV